MHASEASPFIAILAGEDSGDQLGADLIAALRQRYPQARFAGIGGARMQREGFESWYDIRELSLFGFSEVIRHLPRLLRLRKALVARLLQEQPIVVVGIDAPDFNLGVEQRLKQAGLLTVHYVSPSVWAWREKRAEKIGRSASRVLCLFPMEPAIYAKHGVDARFVGHPLADRFALVSDRIGARDLLQLPQQAPVLAVLPGSRLSEVARLGQAFIEAASRVAAAVPGLRMVIPAANPQVRARLGELLADRPQGESAPLLLDGHAHEAMLAADVVLLASGTATLEAMLAKRPMVVGYRVAPAELPHRPRAEHAEDRRLLAAEYPGARQWPRRRVAGARTDAGRLHRREPGRRHAGAVQGQRTARRDRRRRSSSCTRHCAATWKAMPANVQRWRSPN